MKTHIKHKLHFLIIRFNGHKLTLIVINTSKTLFSISQKSDQITSLLIPWHTAGFQLTDALPGHLTEDSAWHLLSEVRERMRHSSSGLELGQEKKHTLIPSGAVSRLRPSTSPAAVNL